MCGLMKNMLRPREYEYISRRLKAEVVGRDGGQIPQSHITDLLLLLLLQSHFSLIIMTLYEKKQSQNLANRCCGTTQPRAF